MKKFQVGDHVLHGGDMFVIAGLSRNHAALQGRRSGLTGRGSVMDSFLVTTLHDLRLNQIPWEYWCGDVWQPHKPRKPKQ